ncbi:MAG: glycosyltransferase [Candidatus Electrothrix sp. EH2]|nr:glycosyltransferase [Candidatus Electrothrix sp. EH2]
MYCKQNRTPQKVVILFTRYPQAGKVKTRLIAHLGPQEAAELHSRMTRQVIQNIEPVLRTGQVRLQVYYCGGSAEEMRCWLGRNFSLKQQQGHDLGERMCHAFEQTWQQGAERVLLIGSDCPGIELSILESGFKYLAGHDLVLGPAADGGYYLIGLRADVQHCKQKSCKHNYNLLFQKIKWGSEEVLHQTIQQAETAKLSFALLPELHDIDRPEDLVHFRDHPGSQ